MALDRFSAPVRAWFETSFAAPTDAQAKGWPAIADGDHTLILAPTGSGKTLAAFLWAIDRLGSAPEPAKDARCRVLYISPLRALATLRSVEYVIVDEIHALAPTKRGAHLMLSLERLEAITKKPPQRIALSA